MAFTLVCKICIVNLPCTFLRVLKLNYCLLYCLLSILSHARQLKTNQSVEAIKWLSYTAEKEGIRIQHVRNGGEKRVGNSSLDGYCEETHTAYEFQGCFWHGKVQVRWSVDFRLGL